MDKTLSLDGKQVIGIIGWYPFALIGDGNQAHEMAVLKVRLEDQTERLVSFPCPSK